MNCRPADPQGENEKEPRETAPQTAPVNQDAAAAAPPPGPCQPSPSTPLPPAAPEPAPAPQEDVSFENADSFQEAAPGQQGPCECAQQAAPDFPHRPDRKETLVIIRYGKMNNRGFFTTHILDSRPDEKFIIRTKRGTEWGQMVRQNGEAPDPQNIHGKVLRRATKDDLLKIAELEEHERTVEVKFAREKIAEHNLNMKLVDVEHILGSEKIIFYFTANGRVDFRDLVKSLAQNFKTRIELKQIGVRDEAKVLGNIGHCGRPLCCRLYMREIDQVTMKMAKIQKSTLDPSKISGACGRLMCCLRYEDEVYRDLKRNSIPKGEKLMTKSGEVEVIDFQILSQKLFVQDLKGERFTIGLDEIIPRSHKSESPECASCLPAPVQAAPQAPRSPLPAPDVPRAPAEQRVQAPQDPGFNPERRRKRKKRKKNRRPWPQDGGSPAQNQDQKPPDKPPV